MAAGSGKQGVFISYARGDGEAAARALHARLQAEAPDVPSWFDRFEIEGGVGWWNQIERALDRAEFLVIVMTPLAAASENTRREWRAARQRGVCVYPVKGVPDAELDYARLPRWMAKSHFYDLGFEWQKLLAHLRRGCQATRVPFMAPPLSASHVERPRETEWLMTQLLGPDREQPVAITAALHGAGGFGKTTLAAAICHDDRVIDAFDDGILWVTLGQTPNLLAELVKLYAALTGERPGFVDVEDAVRELGLKLESRNCLIVIDDAWSAAHVRPFLRGGPGCARLITTRLFDVAVDARRVELDRMDATEALALMRSRIGPAAPDADTLRPLVARLGGWPLPIKLIGSAIRLRLEQGDTAERAVAHAQRSLDKRGIVAFDRADASGREDSVGGTVDASLALLDADARRRCTELGIFAEDETIPLATLAALWGLDEDDSESLASRLDNLSLAEFNLGGATLQLHDVLRSMLRARLADAPRVHARLLDAWGVSTGPAGRLPHPHAWRTVAYHLREAGRAPALRALLLDAAWLRDKLGATDIHALIADFACHPTDPVLDLVRDALHLAAPTLAADPRQFAAQLVARLLGRDEPELVALRAAAAGVMQGAWLRLLHPTIDAPGGMLRMTLVGHERGVTSLAFDARAERLLSGGGTMRLWDARDGQPIAQSEAVKLGVVAAALRADGAFALAAAANGRLYPWDTGSSALHRGLVGDNKRALTAVALSADGRVAVCASREASVQVWDVPGRAQVRDLAGHEDQVNAVALSADGTRAASGSDDGTLRLWQVATGRLEHTLAGHRGAVTAVALSADGRRALSGSVDGGVRLWDAEAGESLRVLSGHAGPVASVALADAADRAITGGADHAALLWDLRDGQVLARLEGHGDTVRAVAIDAAGTRAATGAADRAIKLWRLDGPRAQARGDTHDGAVFALAFSADGRQCVSGGYDGALLVHDVSTGRVVQRGANAHAMAVRSIAFTADGSCVLSGSIESRYSLWPIDASPGTWLPVRHFAPVTYCAMSPRFLVSACADQCVYVWDMPSGARIARWGTRRLFDHLIEPSPKRAALPRTDEVLDLYLSGERVYKVHFARFDRGGSRVVLSATASGGGGFRGAPDAEMRAEACLLMFDVKNGEVAGVRIPQSDPISAYAINATGTELLCARPDHALEWWDVANERSLGVLRGHVDKVNAVVLFADGRHAVSCSRDRSLRVWRLGTPDPIATFTADAALRSLALAGDDRTIAVGDVAGRVHLLRLEGAGSS